MEEIDSLIITLEKFDGVSILNKSIDPYWITFKTTSKTSFAIIDSQVSELNDQYGCSIIQLSDENDELTYQIFFDFNSEIIIINVLNKKLMTILNNSIEYAKNKELGLPDLSLVTLKQIATELKQRTNLTFALIWIENKERDNIAIEGSGSPTQLVGLLARGMHMAIEWADKNIKFYNPNDE